MKKGKYDKAFASFLRLRAHPIIAARDYYYSVVIYHEEQRLAHGAGYFSRLADCFWVPRCRRANYGASTVMLAQQVRGLEASVMSLIICLRCAASIVSIVIYPLLTLVVISFYSSTIFTRVGFTPVQALYASLGYGALQFVSTIPTVFLIDTKGRRTLTLIVRHAVVKLLQLFGLTIVKTFPLMCIFLLAAGLSLLKNTGSKGGRLGPVTL